MNATRIAAQAALVIAAAALAMSRALAGPPEQTAAAFEVLGASAEWVVLRENLLAGASDTDACRYPGLDPSEHVGARVHFVPLPAAAMRGRLFEPELGSDVMPLYSASPSAGDCTNAAQARQRWDAIVAHAQGLGVALAPKPPVPAILGVALQAKACELAGRTSATSRRCEKEHALSVRGHSVRIAVAVTAVPEAPDPARCQFVGHRAMVAVQVKGLDFGTMGAPAPGGFASHYDCRAQQFDALRLYTFEGHAVLLGGFHAIHIADRSTYPFLIVFPTRPVP